MFYVVWTVFLFAVGACVGSFLNVVIYRLPRGESIVFPPSHCPACGRRIRWYDNVPLVSWFALRARCRSCKARISPRYVVVEAATALLAAGLFVWYYVLDLRSGSGDFASSWPTFAAHAVLLCGLLACSVVDVEHWIVPLEVCWAVSAVGAAVGAASPHPFLPTVSPAAGAAAVGAGAGLIAALLLVRFGVLQPSFLDAAAHGAGAPAAPSRAGGGGRAAEAPRRREVRSVAITKAHGVDPRREVLREVAFLAPAVALAVVAYLLVTGVPAVRAAWAAVTDHARAGRLAAHVNGFLAALFGYLIGGLWIWGTRILGTLAFGKEAMGLGDVHILAAVGAVCGWIVPSIAFFVAPFCGLLWALKLVLTRRQRELPYGPWLALATGIVLFFYDGIVALLGPYFQALGLT